MFDVLLRMNDHNTIFINLLVISSMEDDDNQ